MKNKILNDEAECHIGNALAGAEKMLMDLRESLDRKNGDSSLKNYIVYSRVFKLIGMVELADSMGMDVTKYEWLWKLK